MAERPARASASAPAATPAPGRAPNPIRQAMAERPYRYFWFSTFLASLIFGGARFAWVWLVVDNPTAAVLTGGVALGLPHLLVGLPAGTYADRIDRRLLVVRASACGALVLFGAAALSAGGGMNLAWAMITAAAVGTVVAVIQPVQSAMVSTLIPRDLLLTGVALQNLAMQASFFAGSLVSGALIDVFGVAWAFAGFGVLQLLSGWCASRARPSSVPLASGSAGEATGPPAHHPAACATRCGRACATCSGASRCAAWPWPTWSSD